MLLKFIYKDTNKNPVNPMQTTMDAWSRQQFHRVHPSTYTGMRRGRPARDWIYEMERIFQVLRVPDIHLRVQLAVERFTRDALIWWKIVQKYYRVEIFLWADFVNIFCRHHCTARYQIVLLRIDLRKKSHEEWIEELKERKRMRDRIRNANGQQKGMI